MNEDNRNIYTALIKMAVKMARNITDDQEALSVKCLYKQWEKQIGRQLEVGEYIQYDGKLYRVLQQHVAQTNWIPGVGTESLFVVIDKEHSGLENDPIPWQSNMECFNGKYYIEDNVLYLCVRDSGIALQCKIVDVLNNYFVIPNEEQENPIEPPTGEKEEEIENEENPIEPPIEEPKEEEPTVPIEPPIEEGEEKEEPKEEEPTAPIEPPIEEPKEEEPIVPNEPEIEEGEGEEEPTESEVGSLEKPIPYVTGVTPLENGKYYIENDVVYLCNRSEAVVYHPLSTLVGLYVTIV